MKTDKRLKRGLADLSRFFSSEPVEFLPRRQETARFTIEPPQNDVSDPLDAPQFICASFFDSLGIFPPADLIRLLETVKTSFQETFLLSIAPSEVRYDAFRQALPIQDWADVNGNSIHLHPPADHITFGQMPFSQFEEMAQLKTASGPICSQNSASKKAMMVLDSPISSVPRADFLEVLDHGVFVAQPDLNQLQKTYQLIKFCLMRNPKLRCSILLTGPNAASGWELIYERLSAMTSQFLGCDLGFLGWDEGEDFELNPDLLLEESTSLRQLSFKSCLGQTLHRPVLMIREINQTVAHNKMMIDSIQENALGDNPKDQVFPHELSTPEFIALSRLGMELRNQRLH